MALVAAHDFSLMGETVDDDADLTGYPRGTQRWLTERGLAVGGPTLQAGRDFGDVEEDDPIDPDDYTRGVLGRLIARGYVVGV